MKENPKHAHCSAGVKAKPALCEPLEYRAGEPAYKMGEEPAGILTCGFVMGEMSFKLRAMAAADMEAAAIAFVHTTFEDVCRGGGYGGAVVPCLWVSLASQCSQSKSRQIIGELV